MNYSEYSCPCGGRIERRKIDTVNRGFFRDKIIFIYYYQCQMCGVESTTFETDITHKFE